MLVLQVALRKPGVVWDGLEATLPCPERRMPPMLTPLVVAVTVAATLAVPWLVLGLLSTGMVEQVEKQRLL